MSDNNKQGSNSTSINADPTPDDEPAKWLKAMRDKLYTMFCSPMKEEYTHEAFKWAAQLCMTVDNFSWISIDRTWSKDETKMFSCIARLSMTELHILMPMIRRHLTCGDDPDIEDSKILDRSASAEDYDRFGNHLVILESVIKSLVQGQELGDDDSLEVNQLTKTMEGQELDNLLTRLKETMNLISEYLELVHKHWEELSQQRDNEKFSSAEGALRIMSVWLSEDPGCFESQCKRFLIDLFVKNLLLVNRPTQNDLLILAIHSICTSSEVLLEELRGIPNYKEALENYLDYIKRQQNESKNDRKTQKMFKLRCGLVRDLLMS